HRRRGHSPALARPRPGRHPRRERVSRRQPERPTHRDLSMPGAIITREPLTWLRSAVGLVLPAWGVGRRALDGEVRRALTVRRGVRDVFGVFSRYTAWPRFLRHLREVEDLGFGLSRWKAAGPAGLSVSWYARVTRYIPNDLIAWQCESGRALRIAGSVRFEP